MSEYRVKIRWHHKQRKVSIDVITNWARLWGWVCEKSMSEGQNRKFLNFKCKQNLEFLDACSANFPSWLTAFGFICKCKLYAGISYHQIHFEISSNWNTVMNKNWWNHSIYIELEEKLNARKSRDVRCAKVMNCEW